jgi:hypothetical protein
VINFRCVKSVTIDCVVLGAIREPPGL